ncbi:MAG: SDR family oxidoreductase, partial [Thermomicrobium sp.]|nr:SDR family oxidoreductase [Thermomicrobium sp.]
IEASWPAERIQRLGPTIPAQRAGTPEEVASLVVYLASREAGYLTGAAIPVDGAVSIVPGGRMDPENCFV